MEWDSCPETTEFTLKLKKSDNKYAKFAYTLKEGVPLPYKPDIPGLNCTNLSSKLMIVVLGYNLVFSKQLKPVYEGCVGMIEKDSWVFKGRPQV